MADNDSLLTFFAEERQFFDVLEHYLDQVDGRPCSDLEEPLPEIFSNNHFIVIRSSLTSWIPTSNAWYTLSFLRLRQWLAYLQQPLAEFVDPSTDLIKTLSIEEVSLRLQKLSHLLYFIVKVRGYKTIVRFFPHQVQDLSIVISTFGLVLPKSDEKGPNKIVETFSDATLWHFRYILLLWLSLICMIPFDLSRFDQLATLQTQNTSTYQYVERIDSQRSSYYDAYVFQPDYLSYLNRPPVYLKSYASFSNWQGPPNYGLRKLRAKLAGRVALVTPMNSEDSSASEDELVPESIEMIVQDLLECLQDKDTVVRWSGAKYLAKIGKRLPEAFSIQICDAILDLFSLQTIGRTEGRNRSIALHFEQRKGVQSIGSGVRDAAAFPYNLFYNLCLIEKYTFDELAVLLSKKTSGDSGIFPHGIEVLQRADFFTVGLRRSSFLKAAPDVARRTSFSAYSDISTGHKAPRLQIETSPIRGLLGQLSKLLPTLTRLPSACERFVESPGWIQLVISIFSKALTTGSVVARQASARCLGGFTFSSKALQTSFEPTFDLLVACTEEKAKSGYFIRRSFATLESLTHQSQRRCQKMLRLTSTRPSGSRNFGLCCWETIALLLELMPYNPLTNMRVKTPMRAQHGHSKSKSAQSSINRVLTGSRIVIHLTLFKSVRIEAAKHLPSYLSYNSPRVRILTAETLYNALQLQDEEIPEAESLVSETEWSECDNDKASEISTQISTILRDAWNVA
ncbi:hypothetical protein KEM48_008127 [Puccinia striiformis f. sp. tritici PST-130]|nr:hypothetical protein KEM48_008127 [Puccinia striiformis f. sp. tritici PST-130]